MQVHARPRTVQAARPWAETPGTAGRRQRRCRRRGWRRSRGQVLRRDALGGNGMGQRVGWRLAQGYIHGELGAVIVDDGIDVFHTGIGQQVEAIQELDRQHVARAVGAHRQRAVEVFVICQIA